MTSRWNRSALVILGILVSLGAIEVARAHVRITTDLNWSEDIRPIFEAKCMTCHHPGGIAPNYVDLTTYGNKPGQSGARDWAKAIEEEIMTGRMPAWRADERFGDFENQRGLTEEERKYIIAWIQGGAPQGPRRDLPPPPQFTQRDWNLGQPDLVVEPAAAHVVPADANELTVSVRIPLNLDADQWISGYEFFPGVPQIVHTIQAFIHDPEGAEPEIMDVEVTLPYDPLADEDELEEIRQRAMPAGPHFLGQWVRGDRPVLLPDEAGLRLRKGSSIELRMTYRKQTYEDQGKEFSDLSRLGLFFAREPIDLIVESVRIGNDNFVIPAGAEAHAVTAELTLPEDVQLHAIQPHMNHLGRQLRVDAHFPDGEALTLLRIGNYHQKWESSYRFRKSIAAPKGTRLVLTGVYDNSGKNWENPNQPPKDVASGEEPGGEQLVAWVETTLSTHLYIPPPLPSPQPVDEEQRGGMLALNFSQEEADAQRAQVGAIFEQLVDEDVQAEAAAIVREATAATDGNAPANAPSETAPTSLSASAETLGTAGILSAATPETQATALSPAVEPADTVYWCPMRGTGEGQCGLVDFHEPGTCPVCGMALRPRSWFLERFGGQLAETEGKWIPTRVGAEEIYWCVNRGRADHELVDHDAPGACPVDGLPLIHKARFEPVRTYVCLNEPCPSKGMIFYSPGLCPICQQPVQSMGHMDHNPVHGGQLIMADNLYHHLEGSLPSPETFRMYFYNDWKEAIDPRNFAGKVLIERWDEATEDVVVEEFPLEFTREGDLFLTAKIAPVQEFPVNFDALIWLAGEETLFSFAFDGLTVEPEASEAPVIRLHAHTERAPVVIPETADGTAREIYHRDRILRDRISSRDWFALHNPAFDAKDFAEALKLQEQGLGPRERANLRTAIDKITQGAILLDRAGDSQDEPRVNRAYETFSEGVALLHLIFPED